ncbi:MAG: hypothetical protein ACI4IK_04570 [Eubacterium sp.]
MLIKELFLTPNISSIQMGYIFAGVIAFCIFLVCLIISIVRAVKKKKKAAPIIISVVMLIVYLLSGFVFSLSNTGEFEWMLNPDIGFEKIWGTFPIENKKGKDVIYDKNGKEYTYRQYLKGFSYFDKDGNEYILETLDDFNQHQQLKCVNSGKIYDIPDRMLSTEFYISEDGYIYYYEDLPATETIYSSIAEYETDENGTRYFEWTIVSWDSNGKMYYFGTPIDELSQYDSDEYI